MSAWDSKPGETPVDPSGLVHGVRISTRHDLHEAEAANILRALEKYATARTLRGKTAFNYQWMLGVHRAMFCDVWQWAGTVRQRNLNFGVDHSLIGERLGGLALDVKAWEQRDELLIEQSVALHHRAVQIHPFENGNGRWARLLANLWLRRAGKPEIRWPEDDFNAGESSLRGDYLDAIRRADQHDYEPLTALHRRFWPAN